MPIPNPNAPTLTLPKHSYSKPLTLTKIQTLLNSNSQEATKMPIPNPNTSTVTLRKHSNPNPLTLTLTL